MKRLHYILLALCLQVVAYSQNIATAQTKDTVGKTGYQQLYTVTEESTPHALHLHECVDQNGSSTTMDQDGNVWKIFRQKGIDVLMNVRYKKGFGKYYRIDFYLQNNTDSTLHFDFTETKLSTLDGPVKMFSDKKYLNRVQNRKFWRTAGLTFGTLCFIFLLPEMIQNNNANSALTEIGVLAAEESATLALLLYSDTQNERIHEIHCQNIDYLRDFDIEPDNAINGHAYAKYVPSAKYLNFSFRIGGKDYLLSWDTSNLDKIKD